MIKLNNIYNLSGWFVLLIAVSASAQVCNLDPNKLTTAAQHSEYMNASDRLPGSPALQRMGVRDNNGRVSAYFHENGDFTRLPPDQIRGRFEGKLPDSVIAHMTDASQSGRYNEGLRGSFEIRSAKGPVKVDGTLVGADDGFYYLRSSKDGDLVIPREGNTISVLENFGSSSSVNYTSSTGKDLVGSTIREIKGSGYGTPQTVKGSSPGGSRAPYTYYDEYYDQAVADGARFQVHQPRLVAEQTPRVEFYEQIRPGAQVSIQYEVPGYGGNTSTRTLEGRFVARVSGGVKVIDQYGQLQTIPNTLNTIRRVSVTEDWLPVMNMTLR